MSAEPARPKERAEAWQRWLAAAGPWALWTVCPTLVAPTCVLELPAADEHVERIAAELADGIVEGGMLVLLDLPPVRGVRIAARLSDARLAHTVLVLPRWPYTQAVLPTGQLTHVLIQESRRLAPPSRAANVVFVLDGERSRPIKRTPSDARADNRYRLSPAELPNLAALRANGIRRVIKLSHS